MPGYVIGNFFVYSLINAFTPGPGNILALSTVTNYGWKKGANVIKIIVSMTKKKAHLLYTKQIGGLFHVFMDFSIMDYKYFPIRFHVSNVSKCNSNECLSFRIFGQFANCFYKLEVNYPTVL